MADPQPQNPGQLLRRQPGNGVLQALDRGDKLTRATWEAILARPYVAQRVVTPSERIAQTLAR